MRKARETSNIMQKQGITKENPPTQMSKLRGGEHQKCTKQSVTYEPPHAQIRSKSQKTEEQRKEAKFRENPRLRSADMDIVQALADQSFNKVSETRGLNPITISDQNNGLGTTNRVLGSFRS